MCLGWECKPVETATTYMLQQIIIQLWLDPKTKALHILSETAEIMANAHLFLLYNWWTYIIYSYWNPYI